MSILKEMNACPEGRSWADAQGSYREAWETCERGDWMLWAAQKLGVDLRKITAAKVDCVRTVEHLIEDERSLRALRIAQDFADGNATREQLDAAANAAYAAYAAYAANAANAAAAYAYAAAYDASASASANAAAAANANALRKYANIVRKNISFDELRIN